MTLQELKQELADAKDNGQSSVEIVLGDLAKLVAVAEAAKHTYGATFDEDDGEGDGFYVGWEDYMALGKALAQLEGGEE